MNPLSEMIDTDYYPLTEFLRQKIAEADLIDPDQRTYIDILYNMEFKLCELHVLFKSKEHYGGILLGISSPTCEFEEFERYRTEYFAMLKELNYSEYIRVIANEIFNPAINENVKIRGLFHWKDFNVSTRG